MDGIPMEILEKILVSDCLRGEDVVNVALTCRRWRDMVYGSKKTWKLIIYKCYPQYKATFENEKLDWYTELKYIHEIRRRVREMLITMPARFYEHTDLGFDDLKEWSDLITDEKTYRYVTDYLMELVNNKSQIFSIQTVPLLTPGNQTLAYYALKALTQLRQLHLISEIQNFTSLPVANQTYEKCTVFIAQWCQPAVDVSYETIRTSLDQLAAETVEELKVLNPQHKYFEVPEETLCRLKEENLTDHLYGDHKECMEILKAVVIVLAVNHSFHGNIDDFYNMNNSLINMVLEKKLGIPITLCIIFESVARRLGVKCDVLNSPERVLLRFKWKEHPDRPIFIDAYENFCFFFDLFPSAQSEGAPCASQKDILRRMTANLENLVNEVRVWRDNYMMKKLVMELELILCPTDMYCLQNLTLMYLKLDLKMINLVYLYQLLNVEAPLTLKDNSDAFEKQIMSFSKTRSSVKYAIGMIVRSQTSGVKGVITHWSYPEGLDTSPQSRLPYYNVVFEDGPIDLISEDDIELLNNTTFNYDLIKHPTIGKYFSHFYENHFVPNAEWDQQFPHDTLVRFKLYQDKLCSKSI